MGKESPLEEDAAVGQPRAWKEDLSPASRAVRGGLWVVASAYWQIGCGFIANIFLTRLLFPEAFGTFALAMFFAQLVRLQPRLGLGRAFAQQHGLSAPLLGTYLILESLAAALSVGIGLLAVPVLLWLHYGSTVVWVSVALLGIGVLESVASAGSNVLDKDLRFAQPSFVRGLTFPLSYLPAFWLALHGGGVWSLVAQPLSFNALSAAGIWWILWSRLRRMRWGRWRFDRRIAWRLLRFGLTAGAVTSIGLLLLQLDSFYIGTAVGERELGFYNRAARLAQWPVLLLYALLTRVAFFTYARFQDQPGQLRRTTEMVLWLVVNVSFPVSLVLVLTAPDLLTFLYTARWLPSAILLRFLGLFALMRPLMMHANTFFVATGKPGLSVRYGLIQLAVLIVTGYPLTLRWGAPGTCLAVGLMLAVGVALSYWYMWARIGINLARFLAPATLVAALVLVGYGMLIHTTGLANLSLTLRVGAEIGYIVGAFVALTVLIAPRATKGRVAQVWRLWHQP